MILAVIMVAILIFLVFRSRQEQFTRIEVRKRKLINFLLVSSGLLIFIQIIFGTQVREAIDGISSILNYDLRETWVEKVGLAYYLHRSFSIFILMYQLGVLYILFKNKLIKSGFLNFANVIMTLLIAEVVLGTIMAYYGIPPFVQPLHLLCAIIILGVQFLFLLVVNNKNQNVSQKPGILT
jgi:cytochrome c oxidase assembly protein subunit 15